MSSGVPDRKFIASLPPELLKIIPSQQPPKGLLSNFVDPPSIAPLVLGIGCSVFVLATLCFLIRVYTKVLILKQWKWDDSTCCVGFVLSLVYFVWVLIGLSPGGTNGRHNWDVSLEKTLSRRTLLVAYMTSTLQTPVVGIIKISLFIQYYMLFGVLSYVRICVYIGATMCASFYLSTTITGFVLCTPRPGVSLLDAMLSKDFVRFANFAVPIGVIGMVFDWILFVLPLPVIWNLKLSLRKKIGVALVFFTGLLAVIASIMNLHYRIKLHRDRLDPFYKSAFINLWSSIEIFAGVTASSMPSVRHFFKIQSVISTIRLQSKPVDQSIQFIKSAGGKISNPILSFRQWGYRRTTQSTAGISAMENVDTAKFAAESSDGIQLTQAFSVTHGYPDDRSTNSIPIDHIV